MFIGATLRLGKEEGEGSGEGCDEREDEEGDGHGLPEGDVAGGAGLLGDVGKGKEERDQAEEKEGCGEDVEVAAHACVFSDIRITRGEWRRQRYACVGRIALYQEGRLL